MVEQTSGMDTLEVERIIGFNGDIPNGLHVHPDNSHLIYPLGSNVVIEDINRADAKQVILSKHTNNVSCIAIDPTGQYIASGQVNYMGFKACIIIWDYETRAPSKNLEVHKVKVEALAFSKDSQYLFSLGGRDCGSVIVWRLDKMEALCGSPAQVDSAGITYCLAASKCDPCKFVTAGDNTLRVWKLDAANRKITPTNVRLGGGLKRKVLSVELADDLGVPYILCGTETGDILGIMNSSTPQLQFLVPQKERFSLGVTALSIISACKDGLQLLVGTGDGMVGSYDLKWSVDKSHHVQATFKQRPGVRPWVDPKMPRRAKVTSIAKRGTGHQFFVGTANSQIYKFNYSELSADLYKTSQPKSVNHIIFPYGMNELFVTCGGNEIRVWTKYGLELLRYSVENKICNAVCITRNGRCVYSAWEDGKVRATVFTKGKDGSQSMIEKTVIEDCHNKGVTAVAINSAGTQLVTGGGEGQVRVWCISEPYGSKLRADMLANMKEHKGKVTYIQISPKDNECVSASTDGSTIIWDLENNTRKQIMLANTLFMCVCFGEKNLHILTSGTDHKISYWDVQDGSLQRELEGSKTGAINTMDISADRTTFITGGEDRLLKLWDYNGGQVTHVGIGHSNQITTAAICPNQELIISGGQDGAIHIWKYPSNA
ncbi:cilia- and flagella-associated protein 52-like [Babylonia areolata]|uniref:cilia- and flagella-associated protein 52-like n=1 Tax=Babylonia areolata TaxID=304850 RepID=UPI003FD0D26D